MNRLRHPVRAIREPLGTAGLVVACVALIAALGGTALAAAKLNSTQKKEVEKIAKKFAGKPGAPGAAGPQGPAGANGKDGTNGTNGAPGEKGAPGSPGAPGTNGADGNSVVSEVVLPEPGGSCGEEVGGAEYEVENSGEPATLICNGEKGEKGDKGDPGICSATGPCTLPVGVVEDATFSFRRVVQKITVEVGGGGPEEIEVGDKGVIDVPISLPVPLAEPIEELVPGEHIHVQGEEKFGEFCKKTAGNPNPVGSRTVCIYGEWAGTSFKGLARPGIVYPNGTEERTVLKPGTVLFFTAPTAEAAEGTGVVAIRG